VCLACLDDVRHKIHPHAIHQRQQITPIQTFFEPCYLLRLSAQIVIRANAVLFNQASRSVLYVPGNVLSPVVTCVCEGTSYAISGCIASSTSRALTVLQVAAELVISTWPYGTDTATQSPGGVDTVHLKGHSTSICVNVLKYKAEEMY